MFSITQACFAGSRTLEISLSLVQHVTEINPILRPLELPKTRVRRTTHLALPPLGTPLEKAQVLDVKIATHTCTVGIPVAECRARVPEVWLTSEDTVRP